MKKFFILINVSILSVVCSGYGMDQQCFLDIVPFEVHGKIIEYLFNIKCKLNLEKELSVHAKNIDLRVIKDIGHTDLKSDILKKCLMNTHLLLGCKFVDEVCAIEKLCVKHIFFHNVLDVSSLTRAIFCLSKEEITALSIAANPRFMDNGTISEDTYNIIANIKNKNITKGFCLDVVSQDKILKIYVKTQSIINGCFSSFFYMLPAVIFIDALSGSSRLTRPVSDGPSVFSVIMVVVGIGGTLSVVSEGMLGLYNELFCKEEVSVKRKEL